MGSHVVVVAGADCREAVDYEVDCYMPADAAAVDAVAVDAAVVVDVAPADVAAAAAADAAVAAAADVAAAKRPDGFLHLDFPVQKYDYMLPVDDSP